jgi:Protein O-mannosyl-transferase TMEM260-like
VGRLRRTDATGVAALLTGLAAVAVIRTTLLPTVGSWDTAEAQVILPTMGTMHPTGFPAFVVLGWLVSIVLQPLGTPAFLMNLMSALLVGVSVGGTVLVTRRLGARLPVAIAVAAGFALTPMVWSIGNAADVHALHIALVVGVVLGLLRWASLVDLRRERPDEPEVARRADRAIVLTAAAFGVAVANHGLALLLVPPIGLYVLAVEPGVLRRPRLIAAALGASLGVAALLYLELPLRAGILRAPLVYGHPETWSGFWSIILATQFQGDVISPLADFGGKVGWLVDLSVAQFGPLAALIPLGAVVTAVRFPRYALLSILATVITCFFAASYVNARIDRYYLGPVFFAWTWISVLVGTAAERVFAARDPASGEPPWRAPLSGSSWREPRMMLAVALGLALLVPTGIVLPDRWHELDRSQETWVERWLDEAFTEFQPDAVVVSWWSYSTPLWYGQLIEGRRPDVWVVDDRTRLDLNLGEVDDVIDAWLGKRPVYVMRVTGSDIQTLAHRYAIEPVGRPGNLYLVTGRQETTP